MDRCSCAGVPEEEVSESKFNGTEDFLDIPLQLQISLVTVVIDYDGVGSERNGDEKGILDLPTGK